MNKTSAQTRLFHPLLTTLAAIGLTVSAQAASPDPEMMACGSFADTYAAGLSASAGMADTPVALKAIKLSDDFRAVTRSAEDAFVCFNDAWLVATSDDERIAIQEGIDRTVSVFKAASLQFEVALEAISNDLLADVAPAAGPDNSAVGGASAGESVPDGMEVLFDSYMLVERAHELTRRISDTAPGAR